MLYLILLSILHGENVVHIRRTPRINVQQSTVDVAAEVETHSSVCLTAKSAVQKLVNEGKLFEVVVEDYWQWNVVLARR